MKTSRDYLDKLIQLLSPPELHCNRYKSKKKQYEKDKKKLNVEVKDFCPKRTLAAIASAKIKDVAEHDDSDSV